MSETKKDGIGSMIKLGCVLAIFAVASCTVLALVNNFTSPVIQANNEKKATEAMKAVFPNADSFEVPDFICGTTKSGKTTVDSIHLAKKDGNTIGAVVQISGPTYDRSTIMVGLDMSGTVTGMQYLANTDTPGFGQKGSDPTFKLNNGKTFYGQFTNFDSFRGFVAGETFDAISGATITSMGIATMMNDACEIMKECLDIGGIK